MSLHPWVMDFFSYRCLVIYGTVKSHFLTKAHFSSLSPDKCVKCFFLSICTDMFQNFSLSTFPFLPYVGVFLAYNYQLWIHWTVKKSVIKTCVERERDKCNTLQLQVDSMCHWFVPRLKNSIIESNERECCCSGYQHRLWFSYGAKLQGLMAKITIAALLIFWETSRHHQLHY